jgi:hypothetical protein
MKKLRIAIIIILSILQITTLAQVAINNDGSSGDESAVLDVNSTTGGMLIPRMTESQRNQISDPATGLLVFQTDGTKGFYYNSGTPSVPGWIQLSSTLITQLSDEDGDTKVQVEKTSDSDEINFDVGGSEKMIIKGSGNVGVGITSPTELMHLSGGGLLLENNGNDNSIKLSSGGYTDYDNYATIKLQSGAGDNNYDQYSFIKAVNTGSQGTGISYSQLTFGTNVAAVGDVEHMRLTRDGILSVGTTTPESSALVDISSTTKGFLPPRMTHTEMYSISSPATGLIVYNTTYDKPVFFDGTCWMYFDGTKAIYVGDYVYGGIVIWLDGSGGGMVCTAYDLSTVAEWGCEGTILSGCAGTAIGTGEQNTIDILAGCTIADIAADLCNDLSLNGYTDWFLPSKDELNEMYTNKTVINATAVAIGGTAFLSSPNYWSSTQYNSLAWAQDFGTGTQYGTYKSYGGCVRAVRSF